MRFARCGVIGAGTMGTGIAYVLAGAGAEVYVVEPDPGQRERARSAIRARHDSRRDAEPKTQPHLAPLRLDWKRDVAALPERMDLVVEAVPERLELKRQVLRAAEERSPGLLGTNTSSISIAQLAAGLAAPSRLVGLHFFNPVWSMPLIEVVRSAAADPDVIASAELLARELGKEAIVVADVPGFATSRLGVLLGLEAMRMVQDGVASVEDLDRAMELGYRHPIGPLRLTDLIGLDVRLDIARQLQRAHGDRFAPPQILIDKVERGELGRKTGQGFYRWDTS
ncbi:MAG TPA: 3-hydroxyacyl-CoA dehydrogenase family protein [Microlunatus sp.]